MNIFTRFFTKLFAKDYTSADIERNLIRRESQIGASVFGPIPPGTNREFFCLDKETWIWHEESNGTVRTTRYRIKPTEIIKSVNNGQYQRLSLEEAQRFQKATQLYVHRVSEQLYAPLTAR